MRKQDRCLVSCIKPSNQDLSIALILFVFLLTIATAWARVEVLPRGWHYPQDNDYVGILDTRKELQSVSVYVEADFDGNGSEDEAWILVNRKESKVGVFVFLKTEESSGVTQELFLSGVNSSPDSLRLELVPPGRHKTACGKGYWPCGPNELPILHLKNPGLRLVVFEKASEIYYWDHDSGEFKNVAESD